MKIQETRCKKQKRYNNQKTRNKKNIWVLKFGICLYLVTCSLFLAVWADEVLSNIDFVDAPILDVVETLSKQAGLEVVISGKNGKLKTKLTTIHLKKITAREALETVLQANELSFEQKGRAIIVSLENYLNKDKKFNHSVSQVLIESKVIELSESDSMRLGLSFGKQAGVFNFLTDKDTKKTTASEDLQTTLNTLMSNGKANLVAAPKIATLDKHEAIINIGSRIPYAVPVSSGSSSTQWTVNYLDAGVKLKITPSIVGTSEVVVAIQPEVSSVSEWRTTAAGDFPVISTRNAQTTLRVKDGQTIVLGGLISELDRENISRLPILGQLPLLGLLFQNKTIEKTKTEIVFLITPHII